MAETMIKAKHANESKTTARGGGLNIIALEGALLKVQLLK